ncbi:hypothetical protein BDD12DRAFT_759569, partial [Trichophaea hybrida]
WKNRDSRQMWLQDFLPLDVENIRIMTYGYDTNLGSSSDNCAILDYKKNLVQQLENARMKAKHRPLIFVAHSLGGILVLQALIHSRYTPPQKHILGSTRTIFCFGVPHQSLRVAELEDMITDLAGVAETSRLKLLI